MPSFAQQEYQKVYVPVCGKILLQHDRHTKPVKKAHIEVYKSVNRDKVTCCEGASLVSSTSTDRYGNFLVKQLDAGKYFIALRRTNPDITIPIDVPKRYESKTCEIDQRFTVDAATGKTKITLLITVD
jgi:hypothetical protein